MPSPNKSAYVIGLFGGRMCANMTFVIALSEAIKAAITFSYGSVEARGSRIVHCTMFQVIASRRTPKEI
jgi:hypothetical protein